ncbi:MAG TPA: hypothetical protein VGV61_07355, partial [Thermoanaerobaculia bacterium]|jgi:hypothetical protein|nr:hypothetical protein [Thermoanaerobaculia bacterium]
MRGVSPMRVVSLSIALLLAAAATVAASASAAFRCDSTTALTFVGIDTSAQRALFALPEEAGRPAWLIEADLRQGSARAWPEQRAGARFAGSSGPGPVLAASRCGEQCLQVLRFRDGAWQRLGETLLASQANTVNLTWDRGGEPWVVLHRLAAKDGSIAAAAYRLEGHDWVSKGSQPVQGVGNPGAAPAPPGEEGVVSGDGVFRSAGPPQHWLAKLPPVPDAGRGVLSWLGGVAGAYLGADGMLRLTTDGANWQPLRWQPWSGGEGDLYWKAGRDYWIELPDGERGAPLAAVWSDRRVADKPQLFLAERAGATAWRVVAGTPGGILTQGGDRLPFNHLFRFGDGSWALITGCVARQDGASLAIRRVVGGTLRDPQLVPIKSP